MPFSFCLFLVHSQLPSLRGSQRLLQRCKTPISNCCLSFRDCAMHCVQIMHHCEATTSSSAGNGSSMQACQPAIACCMTGFTETVSASPQSDHSVWAASSSDSGLASLAVRLRTLPGSAEYSQDGMCCSMAANIAGFTDVDSNARAVCHVDMISLFASLKGKHSVSVSAHDVG